MQKISALTVSPVIESEISRLLKTGEVEHCSATSDGVDGIDDEYSVSVCAIMERRNSSRRHSKRRRRPSSPFVPEAENALRRRSSVFTTSSGDTAISMLEDGGEGQIFENLKIHKEVISGIKEEPWPLRRKLKLMRQAKGYVRKHEGALQERLAQSRSTRDVIARASMLLNQKWKYFKREVVNLQMWLVPWERRIKEIESHFGSAVASYFVFLRWLFWINLVISVILTAFVATPEMLGANSDVAGERKIMLPEEKVRSKHFLTLWEFEGVLKYSPFFYGWYTNQDTNQGYRLPLAYFLTNIVVYAYSFTAILRKMAENSRMSKLSEKGDECAFSWKLFTAWDFMIGNPETADNRIASIVLGFKESLLEEAEKQRDERNWKITGARISVNLAVLGLLAISAYAVVEVVARSKEPEANSNWWRQNEITVVMTLIGYMFPIFFEILGILEYYHPRKQLRLQLARIMLLNLLNLYSLIFATFYKINEMKADLQSLRPKNVTNSIPAAMCRKIQVPCDNYVPQTVATLASLSLVLASNHTPMALVEQNLSSTYVPKNAYTSGFVQENLTFSIQDQNSSQGPFEYFSSAVETTTSPHEDITELQTSYLLPDFDSGIDFDAPRPDDIFFEGSMWPPIIPTFDDSNYFDGDNPHIDFDYYDALDVSNYGAENSTTLKNKNFTSEYSTESSNFTYDETTDYNGFSVSIQYDNNNGDAKTSTASELSSEGNNFMNPNFEHQDCSGNERVVRCYERICEATETPAETIFVSKMPLDIESRRKLRRLCWETMFGQELAKLTVMDLVLTIISTLCMDFFRALIVRYMNNWWCWDLEKQFPQYGDFKIAENILHLVNNQGMVWMGMFFSPGLVVLNLAKLVILMYLRSWAVLTCNVPHEIVFKASRSNNFYFALLLTMLFLCVLPVGYAIVGVEPSWHCGPFSGYTRIYYLATLSLRNALPTYLHQSLDYIASPGIVIPLILLMALIIFYMVSLTNSLRESNNDLKIQLRQERTEERRKMFKIAEKGAEPRETSFLRWKKILPGLPSSKFSDVNAITDHLASVVQKERKRSTGSDDEGTEGEQESLPHDQSLLQVQHRQDDCGSLSNCKSSTTNPERSKTLSFMRRPSIRDCCDSFESSECASIIPQIRISLTDGMTNNLHHDGMPSTLLDSSENRHAGDTEDRTSM